jgi:threonyl-tRNA synthetase
VDFNLPERFKLLYVDSITERKQPIMIHRAIFGSLERFFGILIENYAGDFPLWLAPVQARVLPVTDTEVPHSEKISLLDHIQTHACRGHINIEFLIFNKVLYLN